MPYCDFTGTPLCRSKNAKPKRPAVFFIITAIVLLLTGCAQLQAPVTGGIEPADMPASGDASCPDPAIGGTPAGSPGETDTGTAPMPSASASRSSSNIADPVERMQPLIDESLDFCQLSQDYWQKGDIDNALEALDRAYSLILGIDTQDIPKLIQEKEDIRFMISKRILEIYASRNIVVNGNHNAIPLDFNRHVEAEIKLFSTGREKDFFLESYKRAGNYLPFITSALEQAGLPTELAWLPLIESGFKTTALSKARALGLWQFIPSTGYKFGLKRDQYIDERLDPYKSTLAAIEYLKELHQIFGDWTTVLAAYNCGEGRVLRLIRSQNINYLDNFWDLYERLPLETARYVPRFLATLHILKDPAKYDVVLPKMRSPIPYDAVNVEKQVHLKNVASAIGMTTEILAELNPELRYQITPQGSYALRVPQGRQKELLAALDKIPTSTAPNKKAFAYHRVRQGDTLSSIANRYHTDVTSIMRANGLRKSNYIVAGKLLKIPQRGYTPATSTAVASKEKMPAQYRVKSGDSLWILANRFGTTTQEIQKINQLQTTQLHIGQVLEIPGGATPTYGVTGLPRYQVKAGDSPFRIAQKHDMTLNRLLDLNKLTPNSMIYPGQYLYVE